jgi:hypothetical protein
MYAVTMRGFLDELEKLGEVTADQARRSLDRLDSLERNKPTAGQVGRYAALGAVAGPAISAVGNVIRGKPSFEGTGLKNKLRDVAAQAAKGSLSAGAVPLVRGHLDRKAEEGTLRTYLKQAASAPTRGNFMMASDVPAFRAPRLDKALQKEGDMLPEGVTYSSGDFRPVKHKAASATTPAGRLSSSRNIGLPKSTAPAGPSVADIAKPKGAGFGTGIAGALKNRI